MTMQNYLRQEFLIRCQKNNKYSLRSFANFLQISHSALSEIIDHKRPLTLKMRQRLALRLGLSPEQMEQMEQMNQVSSSSAAPKLGSDYHPLERDQFDIISDWYHSAILELFTVKGFKPQAAWVANALRISLIEAKMAVERLIRVGLLYVSAQGK